MQSWPDTPIGVIKVGGAGEFVGSDGGLHGGKRGNVDVVIRPNPEPPVNYAYRMYDYTGGGPVHAISPSLPGKATDVGRTLMAGGP